MIIQKKIAYAVSIILLIIAMLLFNYPNLFLTGSNPSGWSYELIMVNLAIILAIMGFILFILALIQKKNTINSIPEQKVSSLHKIVSPKILIVIGIVIILATYFIIGFSVMYLGGFIILAVGIVGLLQRLFKR